jgi:hypothetical protein
MSALNIKTYVMTALKKAQTQESYFPTGGVFFQWTHVID